MQTRKSSELARSAKPMQPRASWLARRSASPGTNTPKRAEIRKGASTA
jgi:hypothetical protein